MDQRVDPVHALNQNIENNPMQCKNPFMECGRWSALPKTSVVAIGTLARPPLSSPGSTGRRRSWWWRAPFPGPSHAGTAEPPAPEAI